MIDPDAGNIADSYDAFGQHTSHTAGQMGQRRTQQQYYFDALGRVTEEIDSDGSNTHTWDVATNVGDNGSVTMVPVTVSPTNMPWGPLRGGGRTIAVPRIPQSNLEVFWPAKCVCRERSSAATCMAHGGARRCITQPMVIVGYLSP